MLFRLAASALCWLVIGLSLACGGGRPVSAPATYQIGERIAFDGWSAQIHGSRRARGVGQLIQHAASDGATLVVLDVTVANEGERPIALLGSISLVDEQDRRFEVTPACQFAMKGSLGTLEQIQPGLEKRGTLCFEVPADASLSVAIRANAFAKPGLIPL